MLFIVHLEKRTLVHRKLSDIQRNLGVSDSVTLLKLKEDQEIERNVPKIQGTARSLPRLLPSFVRLPVCLCFSSKALTIVKVLRMAEHFQLEETKMCKLVYVLIYVKVYPPYQFFPVHSVEQNKNIYQDPNDKIDRKLSS
ncbi:hypothetical protein KQX54_008249 [Cotesia glomerata]|uniref:Uncharacterized protein n=1 Tax=Cotesia glomerata TaxID=32391 RepID=A0AAV7IRB6_COTGL|nr:hypothetical protein KQX54_008249 [Cotesia glomerata]